MDLPEDRRCYQSSANVDWARLLLFSPVLIAAVVGIAWCQAWAFLRGWYFVIVTPMIAAMLVGVAARLVIGWGHCRNKILAAFIGGMAGLIAFVGYFHMHLIALAGPAMIARFDALPGFIRFRMATDVIVDQQQQGPNEVFNWMLGGIELVVITAIAAAFALTRSTRAYCEGCRSWMRRQIASTPPGTGRILHRALMSGRLDGVEPPGLFHAGIGKASTLIELEYCLKQSDSDTECPAYLTLRENYRGPDGRPKADKLVEQWELTAAELRDLAGLVPALRLAPGAASTIVEGTPKPLAQPSGLAIRQEINPGAS